MSEQMFGIKVNGGIVDAAPSADEATDKAIIFYSRHHQHPWQIVPVRIVEDAEPCEWEVSNESWRVVVKNEWQGNGSPDPFVESSTAPKFCPVCGRKLEAR